MEKIERKTMLYKTGVEYGDYTLNYVLGCAHGCTYPCYAMQMAKRFGKIKTYTDWCSPKLAENTLEILDKEIPRLRDKIHFVHLCFTTDPFMYGFDEISHLSIQVIQKLNTNNIPCTVLTKGLLPEELANLSRDNEYGITLVSTDEEFRKKFEPNAASTDARIHALRKLHEAGCRTWVSIEPYPTPNIFDQNLNDVLNVVSFADKIIFGRMHYNKKVTEFKDHKLFYNDCVRIVIDYCNAHNIAYHIKKGTVS